jgi:Ca2+/Na+ antiporter
LLFKDFFIGKSIAKNKRMIMRAAGFIAIFTAMKETNFQRLNLFMMTLLLIVNVTIANNIVLMFCVLILLLICFLVIFLFNLWLANQQQSHHKINQYKFPALYTQRALQRVLLKETYADFAQQ